MRRMKSGHAYCLRFAHGSGPFTLQQQGSAAVIETICLA